MHGISAYCILSRSYCLRWLYLVIFSNTSTWCGLDIFEIIQGFKSANQMRLTLQVGPISLITVTKFVKCYTLRSPSHIFLLTLHCLKYSKKETLKFHNKKLWNSMKIWKSCFHVGQIIWRKIRYIFFRQATFTAIAIIISHSK